MILYTCKRPRRRGRAVALALALAPLAATSSARGDTPPAAASPSVSERAELLYNEAKKLGAEGRWVDACLRYEESQKLEPAIGTQFNLAECYAKTSRPATALALFTEVMKVAQMTGKEERQRAAEERIAALDQSVPRLRLVFADKVAEGSAKRDGDVIVRRDGAPVAGAHIGEAVPVDPGEHLLSVTATGRLPWETRVTVGDTGTVDVTVPQHADVPRPPARPRTSPLTYIGLGMGGLGIAAVGVGAVFGLAALNGKNDAGCQGVDCRLAPNGSVDKLRDAQTSATLSTVFFVTGALLIAGGTTVWLIAPKTPTAVTASASIAPGSAGFTLGKPF